MTNYCPDCGEYLGNQKTHSCPGKFVTINWGGYSEADLLVELLKELKETNRLLKIIEYTGRKQ